MTKNLIIKKQIILNTNSIIYTCIALFNSKISAAAFKHLLALKPIFAERKKEVALFPLLSFTRLIHQTKGLTSQRLRH